MQDFFISYNSADKFWAEGLANWLDQACYTTILQAQDFVAGSNFVGEMHKALQSATRTIMVLSPDYLSAKFPFAEWTAAFATDPACEKGTMIPVRVRECSPDGLLRPIVYIDLVGKNATEARQVFLDGIASVIKRKRVRKSAQSVPASPQPEHTKFKQEVKGPHSTAIQAERIDRLIIKATSKKLPSVQPANVVGADVEMRAYLEYLIDRYIDWRMDGIKRGRDKRPFHPSMIHRNIKRDFGARTYLIPKDRFIALMQYLQARIDDTIKGRNNSVRNYHSFEEHVQKLRGM